MKFKHMLFCGAVFKDDKNTIEIGTLPINRIFNQTTDTWYFANKRSSTRFRQLWNSRVFKILKILEIRNSSVHFVRRLSDEYHLLQKQECD